MFYFSKYFIPFSTLICLVILKLCIAVNKTDLSIICSVCDYLMKNYDLPKQCTAVVQFSQFLDCFPIVQSNRGALPLIIIINTDYETPEKIKAAVDNMNRMEYDFLVFDLCILIDKTYAGVPFDFGQFIKDVKPKNKVGILIGNDVEWLRGKIDFKTIDSITEFYILLSIDYRECKHHEHQNDMPTLATLDEVEGSIKCLLDMSVPHNKLIYTMDLKVETRRRITEEAMNYSYLCENEFSSHRKYCFSPIQLLFDTARLRIKYNTTGIFVKDEQYDDVRGTCGCTTASDPDPTFRGIKTIAGASQESVNPVDFYQCNKGAFPVIK